MFLSIICLFPEEMKDSIWNHNPAKFVKECRRLQALCQRIVDGDESIIEGSRKMRQFQFWMKEEDNDDWTIFLVVDSESDHLPVGVVRSHWNEQALKEKDREIDELEKFYSEQVRSAAATILSRYEGYAEQYGVGESVTRSTPNRC